MPELIADWATRLSEGAHRIFGFLQVDIESHSELPGAEILILQTRGNLHRVVSGVLSSHDAQELSWSGDGGAYLFLIEDGTEYNQMVTGALRVLDSLPLFNTLRSLNSLDVPIHLRISCHMGHAIWDHNLKNFYGKALNYFLKSERNIGVRDHVAITEEVLEQLSDNDLRSSFIEHKEHAYLAKGKRYERKIFVRSGLTPLSRSSAPRVVPYPRVDELADLAAKAKAVDLLLSGGDSFYTIFSQALSLRGRFNSRIRPDLRILLRRSSAAAQRSAAKYLTLHDQFEMKVEIRWYDFDFMLRGYCFDGQRGFFSYFLRENDRLVGRQNKMIDVLAGRSEVDDFLVELFARTFNSFFERPDALDQNAGSGVVREL
ncbi:MAG: hypothetical protein WAN65_19780 [Candidatus Sulfotelmatobacter sp.]